MSDEKQLVVIGAGPGGYAAAFFAADSGMKVTLIDPELNPGGVCLYCGCIPSKALLHVAKLLSESEEAKEWGIEFAKPVIDLVRLRGWKDEVVKNLTAGLGQLSKARKIEYIRGKAVFAGGNKLKITGSEGKDGEIAYRYAILATGSRPAVIPTLALDSPRVMNSTGALDLPDIPKSLLIVGGGYIGLELGTVYAALGTRVTVVEMTSGLLPGADRDLVAPLSRRLKDRFEGILLDTTVKELKEQKNGIKARLDGKEGGEREMIFEKVLISVGRKPNTENLGFDATKIRLTERGFVRVDERLQTDDPSIFAIGDVVGEPMLAHKASHEARVAVEAIEGKKVAFAPLAIPAVVFTDPEIAWAGLTESQAKKENREIKVAKFQWAASGRATTLGRNEGVTKLIIDPQTERILGVGITGPGAGEMIAEGALAIEMAASATDLALTIHPHPTLSETIMEAAEVYFGTSTHLYRPRRG